VAMILLIFPIISRLNFVYLLIDRGFLSCPWISVSHRASSIHRMDAPYRHKGQTNKRTNVFLRPFVSQMEFDIYITIDSFRERVCIWAAIDTCLRDTL